MLESLAACRLPLAACRLPLAACRLPLAACLLTLCSLTIAASNSDARARGGFADFYKQQQTRILSAIDDTLATQAERAITDNFAAVKSAGVQVQTGLGGRKGNIGVNIIGAFAESDSRAFGWQVRGYGGEDSAFGANAGVFYRAINGGMLFGANAFADYEDGDYGGFSRFGIGGELRNAWLGLHANYYTPITDEKRVNATVAAFSRQGFDAKLRINPPGYDKLKAAMDYYNFDGKRGTKAEDGLRYGMELNISPALKAAVFYDDGADKVGGELSYSHTIGESQTRQSNSSSFLRRQESITDFAPDLFAPVSREYSQRIMTVATGPGISLRITPLMTIATITETAAAVTTATTMTAAAVTTTMTTRTPTMTATRMASVLFTVREDAPAGYIVSTTRVGFFVTLPPIGTPRPYRITTTRNLNAELVAAANGTDLGHVIEGDISGRPVGSSHSFDFSPFLGSTLTITEGSEQFISVAITLTSTTTMTMAAITTSTTMTILPISTTTRITTFATMFITLTANAAMGDISGEIWNGALPFDDGGGKGGGITKPPLAIALSPSSSFPPNYPSFLRRQESIAAKRRIIMPRPVGRG